MVSPGGWSVTGLSVRNAGRHRGRSLLTVGLIAFASFALVTVASMKQRPGGTGQKNSGTGGYSLVMQAEMPLLGDLNTANGRDLLAVRESRSHLWGKAKFMSLRTWAGQDISCLNLMKASRPTIVGVPREMVERRGFAFAGMIRKAENPWELLEDSSEKADEIPVFADGETAAYILKLGMGDVFPFRDSLGRAWKLRLVGTLSHSIFQSELLMSEANFLRLFPSQSGYGMVLVEAKEGDVAEIQRLLSTELEDFAVTVERTSDRLARYQQVANTYLSTFQALGTLGLMLGTIGLAVVLLRNLVERKGELALLAAIGFRQGARLQLVMVENAYLLVMGLLIGSGAALVAVLPARRALNLWQLGVTLGVTLVLGLAVLGVATVVAGKRVCIADLRGE